MRSLNFLFAVIASVAFLSNGCTATEVRDRSYLQALELQSSTPAILQFHDFSSETMLLEQQGETIETAISSASVPLGKELFLGHLELIAYSDPKDGVQLQKLMETYRLSPGCHVLGLPENATLENTDTSLLIQQLQASEKTGAIPETSLFTILREFSSVAGTALVPIPTQDGFSTAVVTAEKSLGTLSQEAVAGLCWLRGDNYPTQIVLPDGTVCQIQNAKTTLGAKEKNGTILLTVTIQLKTDCNFQEAASQIQSQCENAIQETVTEKQADVFSWLACVQSKCYRIFAAHKTEELFSMTVFQVEIQEL